MSRKINPNLIRLNISKTWPSAWHSEYNYTYVNTSDFFIRKYLRTQFKCYGLDVGNVIIKRTSNFVFIYVFLFNTNFKTNAQFKPFLFLRHWWFIRPNLDQETRRFTFALRKILGSVNTKFCYAYIRRQKPNLKEILLTGNPSLLAGYFGRRYAKMNSFKYILKSLKKVYRVITRSKVNLKGVKVKLSGPVKAPRNRRSISIKKNFFGTVPLFTYINLVSFALKSRVLAEGVVTAKFWFFKNFGKIQNLSRLFIKKKLLDAWQKFQETKILINLNASSRFRLFLKQRFFIKKLKWEAENKTPFKPKQPLTFPTQKQEKTYKDSSTWKQYPRKEEYARFAFPIQKQEKTYKDSSTWKQYPRKEEYPKNIPKQPFTSPIQKQEKTYKDSSTWKQYPRKEEYPKNIPKQPFTSPIQKQEKTYKDSSTWKQYPRKEEYPKNIPKQPFTSPIQKQEKTYKDSSTWKQYPRKEEYARFAFPIQKQEKTYKDSSTWKQYPRKEEYPKNIPKQPFTSPIQKQEKTYKDSSTWKQYRKKNNPTWSRLFDRFFWPI